VDHAEPADGHRAHEHVAVRDLLLREHADVHGIAVADDPAAAGAAGAEGTHPLRAQRARQEPVEAGAHVRILLRPVHAQDARDLVHLVLHGVGGDDLDVGRDHAGGVRAHGRAVPGMRAEAQIGGDGGRFARDHDGATILVPCAWWPPCRAAWTPPSPPPCSRSRDTRWSGSRCSSTTRPRARVPPSDAAARWTTCTTPGPWPAAWASRTTW